MKEEEKKYRVICETEKQHRVLKRIYPNIHGYIDGYYFCTWCHNTARLAQFNESFNNNHIKSISFQEWEKDYYATNQLTNTDHDIF